MTPTRWERLDDGRYRSDRGTMVFSPGARTWDFLPAWGGDTIGPFATLATAKLVADLAAANPTVRRGGRCDAEA